MPWRKLYLLTSTLIWGPLDAQDIFQVHGYVQGRFTNQEGTPERLEVRRARLIVFGDATSRLSYRVQGDFAKRPYLMDLSLTYRFSQPLLIAVGQMKIPFSAENLISDDRNPPVSRSRAVLMLSPGRDTGVQGRDTGVEALGSFGAHRNPAIEYAGGVFRGQTFIYSPKVHYDAIAGRVIVHPAHGLSAGGDWYSSFSAPPGLVKRREELEGAYEHAPYTIRAEQIWARDGALIRRGGYVLGVRRLRAGWEALARADWLTTDARKPNTSSVAYIGGANVTLWRHVKIGMDAGAQRDQGPRGWSSVFVAQVMPFF